MAQMGIKTFMKFHLNDYIPTYISELFILFKIETFLLFIM